jgi:DHA2 family multidrug resistance protein
VTLWDNRASYHYDIVAQSVTHASANTQRFVQALHGMGIQGTREFTTLHQIVQQQAYMMATGDMFLMASLTCIVLAAMMWLTRPRRGAAATLGH